MTEIQFPLIILAAGASSRMGEPKGLVKVGRVSWLEVQLRRFQAAGGVEAVVVLGFDRDRYMVEISRLMGEGPEGLPGIHLVENPKPERGPFSSLMEGWGCLKEKRPGSAAYIMPVDVPCPPGQVFQALSDALEPGVEVCVPQHQDRGGHPILATAAFMEKLASLPIADPNSRLDWQIKNLPPEKIRKVTVEDELVLMNLNRKEDLLAVRSWIEAL